ncbi:GspH/FimT family pseudopilin [Cognatilysobacter tabacisoli]|uniref:GspH/FimT family pseudopilin n=1 Tax=Cognatilysobacter tabacisoli TaxID=2315424 RepID=UPI000E6B3E9D|nr:GspH/FimT family pseudopilin [Lysobacter tabacisoli]
MLPEACLGLRCVTTEVAVHRSRGFTLIELLVVVAVLAVMLTLAAPSFTDFFERYRLRGAADEVVTLLASARAESVMRNRDVAVSFGGSGAAWCVGAKAKPEPATPGMSVVGSEACDCTAPATCTMDANRPLVFDAADFAGVSIGTAPANLIFSSRSGGLSPLGTTASTSLTSPSGKYTLQLDVSQLGRATLCVPSGQPAMAGFDSCS